jgi:hypothetical protein
MGDEQLAIGNLVLGGNVNTQVETAVTSDARDYSLMR